jgi:hypothetical protein
LLRHVVGERSNRRRQEQPPRSTSTRWAPPPCTRTPHPYASGRRRTPGGESRLLPHAPTRRELDCCRAPEEIRGEAGRGGPGRGEHRSGAEVRSGAAGGETRGWREACGGKWERRWLAGWGPLWAETRLRDRLSLAGLGSSI